MKDSLVMSTPSQIRRCSIRGIEKIDPGSVSVNADARQRKLALGLESRPMLHQVMLQCLHKPGLRNPLHRSLSLRRIGSMLWGGQAVKLELHARLISGG